MTAPRLATDLLASLPGDEPPAEQKRLVERTINISVEAYVPAEGRMRQCSFESTVPTLPMRQKMSMLFARLIGNLRPENMDGEDRAYFTMLSTVCVQCPNMPDWFLETIQENVGYLMQVYNACCEHTARYLRGERGAGGTEEEGAIFRLSTSLPPAPGDEPR